MNKSDVIKIQAGREMDALIATEFFGWKWIPWSGNKEQKVLVKFEEWAEKIDWWGKDVMAYCPRYSENIFAAWAIIEKFKNSLGEIVLDIDGDWRCYFGEYSATADTAPLAICRAILMTRCDK